MPPKRSADFEGLLRAFGERGIPFVLPAKRLELERRHLDTDGAKLLMTKLGPLDLLGRLATGWRHADLLERAREIALEPGMTLRILDLASLIESTAVLRYSGTPRTDPVAAGSARAGGVRHRVRNHSCDAQLLDRALRGRKPGQARRRLLLRGLCGGRL